MFLKMKDIILLIKNNILSDKYHDFEELNFINNNIKIFDEIFDRFNNYMSVDIFNNKYLKKIEHIKELQITEINQIIDNIYNYHKIINTDDTNEEYNTDFCINFDRKKSYIEGNGNVFYISNSDYYCSPISSSSNNYNQLSKISIYSDDNINIFKQKFNENYVLIERSINSYNSKINDLKNILVSTEKDTINKNYTLDYLIPIQNQINTILSEKYGSELIKACYNHYQQLTESKVEKILKDISNK